MTLRWAFVLGLVVPLSPLLTAKNTRAEVPGCFAHQFTEHLEERLGSSSLFGNLFGSKDSIKSQLRTMLLAAEERLQSATRLGSQCPVGCRVTPKIEFNATPRRLLADHPDLARCESLFQQTLEQPITYTGQHFPSFRKLSEGFLDLAQGSGEHGEDLYKRCNGACSPQYQLEVRTVPPTNINDEPDYISDMVVVCGPPRDREDNQYILTTQLIWQCEPE